jgi:predicted ATP-dependent endonuclease of OLD family
MLKYIKIERFRGFHQLEMDVPKVLVLMGPNSSGKTTVLHAVRMTCQSLWLMLTHDVKWNHQDQWIKCDDFLVRDLSELISLSDGQALFTDQKLREDLPFCIDLRFDDQDPISLISLKGIFSHQDQLKLSVSLKTTAFINQQINEFLKKHLPKAIFIPPFYDVIRQEEYRNRLVVDSMMGSANQNHVVRNLISRLSTQQFIQLNAFLKEMVNAELVYRTQGDDVEQIPHLRVTFRDSNGALELSAAGAGLINLIAIYASLARWQQESNQRQILFLLDEPEAHLHPKLQSFTADRLASLITFTFNATVMMATHSVEIINQLGDREDAMIFRTDRLNLIEGGQRLVGHSALIDDISQWADLTPFSAMHFLAHRKILFFEGKTDGMIFRKCADLLYRNHPKKKKAFDRWTLVQLDGSSYDQVAVMLARLLGAHLVGKDLPLDSFKILVQLDKDFQSEVLSFEQLKDVDIPTYRNCWTKHSIESLFCEADVLYQWIKIRYTHVNMEMIEHALEVVNTDVWQRAKDRASKILREIKQALGKDGGNMPTVLHRLIERTDVDLFAGGHLGIVPTEIRRMLDWMVDES